MLRLRSATFLVLNGGDRCGFRERIWHWKTALPFHILSCPELVKSFVVNVSNKCHISSERLFFGFVVLSEVHLLTAPYHTLSAGPIAYCTWAPPRARRSAAPSPVKSAFRLCQRTLRKSRNRTERNWKNGTERQGRAPQKDGNLLACSSTPLQSPMKVGFREQIARIFSLESLPHGSAFR